VRKVIRAEPRRAVAVGQVALRGQQGFDPSKPLANVKHERFCWAVVQGHRLGPAYEIAGFEGKSPRLPWQLRHKRAVDARMSWLLAERIKADTRARHRVEEKIADARWQLISELERIAYADTRDVVQWDREPELDPDGNLIGFKDTMKVTPSHLLTKDQAAQVRSLTTKSGSLKFEAFDKLAALTQLAKILGMAQDTQTQAVNNATVNVQQVNIGGYNALEAVRRLAFAIQKAQHSQALVLPTIEGIQECRADRAETLPLAALPLADLTGAVSLHASRHGQTSPLSSPSQVGTPRRQN
jgi:hypothetical protein